MVDEIKATGLNFRTGPIGRLGAYAQNAQPVSSGSATATADSVEFSELATLRGKYASLPDVRTDLVNRVRAEIQAGTYDTPDKWDQAVENLIEDLQT